MGVKVNGEIFGIRDDAFMGIGNRDILVVPTWAITGLLMLAKLIELCGKNKWAEGFFTKHPDWKEF